MRTSGKTKLRQGHFQDSNSLKQLCLSCFNSDGNSKFIELKPCCSSTQFKFVNRTQNVEIYVPVGKCHPSYLKRQPYHRLRTQRDFREASAVFCSVWYCELWTASLNVRPPLNWALKIMPVCFVFFILFPNNFVKKILVKWTLLYIIIFFSLFFLYIPFLPVFSSHQTYRLIHHISIWWTKTRSKEIVIFPSQPITRISVLWNADELCACARSLSLVLRV